MLAEQKSLKSKQQSSPEEYSLCVIINNSRGTREVVEAPLALLEVSKSRLGGIVNHYLLQFQVNHQLLQRLHSCTDEQQDHWISYKKTIMACFYSRAGILCVVSPLYI